MSEKRSAGEELEELSALFTRGQITADEFMSRKAQLQQEQDEEPVVSKRPNDGLVLSPEGATMGTETGEDDPPPARVLAFLEAPSESPAPVGAPSFPGHVPDAPATGDSAVFVASHAPPRSPSLRHEIDTWVERADKAFAAARTAMTPEAWREAGQLSLVVADVVAAVESEVTADQRAHEAARQAKEMARAAQVAMQEAQQAATAARDLHDTVSRALSSGTPDAWQRAARVASRIGRARSADTDRDISPPEASKASTADPGPRATVARLSPPRR